MEDASLDFIDEPFLYGDMWYGTADWYRKHYPGRKKIETPKRADLAERLERKRRARRARHRTRRAAA